MNKERDELDQIVTYKLFILLLGKHFLREMIELVNIYNLEEYVSDLYRLRLEKTQLVI